MRGRVFALIAAACMLSSCILAPAIDSFRRAGVTESDRQRLLGERLKDFHDSLYWGDPEMALAYAEPEEREKMRPAVEAMSTAEKVVESKILSTQFSDSAYDAHVRVKVRSYKVPFYIVNERIDEQDWKFGLSDGWLLVALKKGA